MHQLRLYGTFRGRSPNRKNDRRSVSSVVLSLKTSQKWNPPKKRRVTEKENEKIVLQITPVHQPLREYGEGFRDHPPPHASGQFVVGNHDGGRKEGDEGATHKGIEEE